MRVLRGDVVCRSPRSFGGDRRISEPGDLRGYKSDLYDGGEGLPNLVAERETQHWIIGRGNTRIHHAKGPLVPWNDSSGSASSRAIVWIGIYVHSKVALSAWCVELALQAIHGAAAGCSSNLLVCRHASFRDGLSFILAVWSAGSARPDDLHGLDFEVAHASLFYGSNPCSDGVCHYCHASQRCR